MASTREIRRRIRSIRNISQITRAMEMVAASKMRRSQQRVLASRPYAERLEAMIGDLAALHLDEDAAAFPLLAHREIKKIEVLLVTPDKGLTGPLNSNILRRAGRFVLNEAEAPVQVVTVGRKGRDFMIRTRQEVVAEFSNLKDSVEAAEILPITDVIMEDYISGKVDAVYLIYARFENTLTQTPTVHQLLPIEPPEATGTYSDYIFEPNARDVLNSLLPRLIDTQIYQAILENFASEYSARMVAMRNASENAKDLVSELTLTYNKARQSQITAEVSEISAGANALRERG
ncbi:MAG TPA: ATP synthase F1 subunit gamma [Thermomicrobiales bacterium]|nr:ATP synthase F1 subunit gamma [Thermomicrobiales bacterium]